MRPLQIINMYKYFTYLIYLKDMKVTSDHVKRINIRWTAY